MKFKRRLDFGKGFFQKTALSLSIAVLLFLTYQYSLFPVYQLTKRIDYLIYDAILTHGGYSVKTQVRVVIIDIDEHSIEAEGKWPWPRDKLANLIKRLKAAGVVVTALDMVMSSKDMNYAKGLKERVTQIPLKPDHAKQQLIQFLDKLAPRVDNDKALAQAMIDYDVVLGFLLFQQPKEDNTRLPNGLTLDNRSRKASRQLELYRFGGYQGNLDILTQAAAGSGFVTNLADEDGKIRHALLLARYKDKIYANLALATAMRYLLVTNLELRVDNGKLSGLDLDGTFVPTDPQGRILIPYWGPPTTLDYYSATDVLQGKVGRKELAGSIAVIGSTLLLLSDFHASPVAVRFPGAEIIGNIITGIISQQLISSFDWKESGKSSFILLYGILLAVLFAVINIRWVLLLTFIMLISLPAISICLFIYKNVYVPVAIYIVILIILAITNFIYTFILEKRQKKQVRQLFGQYVPSNYVNQLLENPELCSMEGQARNMTVLFLDIRNFTTLSESLNATEVKRLLNTFFTPITKIIFKHGGTIDKYVGDMVVAFWGAPIGDEHHANHAMLTALDIMQDLPNINTNMQKQRLPAVRIGIGLASGVMNVGDMGSEFRRAYTVLGDAVNLGSRLQDLTKFYQVDILVNDELHRQADEVLWRSIDKVMVKGRHTALKIYEPIGIKCNVLQEKFTEAASFEKALAHYYEKRWQDAETSLQKLHEKFPETWIYQLYLHRIEAFKKTPPPKDWNGVFIHTHK